MGAERFTVQAVRGVLRYSGSRAVCVTGSSSAYADHDDLFFVTR